MSSKSIDPIITKGEVELIASSQIVSRGAAHPLGGRRTAVGEFRKTRHPRNVKLNKVLEVCFSGAGNLRISEAWNLRSLEFANVLSSGILIRQRSGVTSVRKPGISTGDGPNFGELPIRESDEDPVRGSGVWTSTNQRGRKDQFGDLLKI
jgi:hypothetical protein